MTFMQALRNRWRDADTLVCVGLDPEPAKFPARFANDPDAVFAFCRAIADAIIHNQGLTLEALQTEVSAIWALWNNTRHKETQGRPKFP